MKYILKHTEYIYEEVTATDIICDKCGHTWPIAKGGNDLYMCHECNHDNTPLNTSK